jgi:glutamate-1-semialdehyde 2,1-aminomutase
MSTATDTRMILDHARAIECHSEARDVLAGGVSSNFRLNGTPVPLTFERAEGPRLYDVDANVYLDYALGMGAALLGHGPAPVLDAVRASLGDGQLYAGQHRSETELARRLRQRMPSMELLRFGGSGSEMIHAALRLARAFTDRSLVVKFEGHYHGWFDDIAVNISPPWAEPDSDGSVAVRGISRGQLVPDQVAVLPWNNAELLDRFITVHGHQVAAIINEPIGCNTCVIQPAPGFVSAMREAATRVGAVLIYDEVITGLRVAPGGAQERLGITPDLTVLAKALGGGFPLAALGGRAELMEQVVSGGVLHGGTFNANTAAIAAGLAVLDGLDAGAYARIEHAGARLTAGLRALGQRHGLPLHVQGLSSVFNTAFTRDGEITSAAAYARADGDLQARFLVELQERGVRPTARGTWFVSATHDDEVIDQTLHAADGALEALAG